MHAKTIVRVSESQKIFQVDMYLEGTTAKYGETVKVPAQLTKGCMGIFSHGNLRRLLKEALAFRFASTVCGFHFAAFIRDTAGDFTCLAGWLAGCLVKLHFDMGTSMDMEMEMDIKMEIEMKMATNAAQKINDRKVITRFKQASQSIEQVLAKNGCTIEKVLANLTLAPRID